MLCGSSDLEYLTRLISRYAPDLTRPVAACRVCGHVQVTPLYSDEQIAQINQEFLGAKYAGDTKRAEIDETKKRRLREHLDGLLEPGTRVLDVGGGTGWALDVVFAHGGSFDFVEPLDALSRRLETRGAVRVARSWNDPGLADRGEYDVVLLRHVLEHLPDPRAVLDRVADLTSPGGHAYIAVPNGGADDLDRKGFRTNFLRPTHLSYFHSETFMSITADSGLTPIREFVGAEIAVVFSTSPGASSGGGSAASNPSVYREQQDRYRRIARRSVRSDMRQALHEAASYVRRRLKRRSEGT